MLVRCATLILDFGTGPETYRFAVLDIANGLDVGTLDSPLGHALAGTPPEQPVAHQTPREEALVNWSSSVPPPWRDEGPDPAPRAHRSGPQTAHWVA